MSLILRKYPDLSKPLYHYGGSVVLRFSPEKWLYLMEGADGTLTPIDGVTNTLKIVDKSAALIGWSTRLFLEKAVALAQEHRRDQVLLRHPGPGEKVQPEPEAEVLQDVIRQQSAVRGRLVPHRPLEPPQEGAHLLPDRTLGSAEVARCRRHQGGQERGEERMQR